MNPQPSSHRQALSFERLVLDGVASYYRRAHSACLENGYFSALCPLLDSMTHSLADLLTPVCEYPSIIQRLLPHDSPAVELSKRISNASDRICELNQQLIRLCRGYTEPARDVDLPMLVRGVLSDLAQQGGAALNAEIDVETDSRPCILRASYEALYHLVRNLSLNAFAALRDGGTLAIRIGSAEVTPDDVAHLLGIPARTYLCLQFRDDGPGIPESCRDTLFDPFVVGASSGEGLGLGLSCVYRTVHVLRGAILYNPRSGFGADFILFFPKANA
jgi:signal transduction histidine kinase